MNFKKISLLIVLLLIADQALKIWIKTHMHLDESIVVFPDWFQLRFIENNGAAFGMHIASRGGFDWGKLLLGVFRIVMVGFIGWLMHHLINKRKDTPKGVIVGLALVMAGALGNIIDSAFTLSFATSIWALLQPRLLSSSIAPARSSRAMPRF